MLRAPFPPQRIMSLHCRWRFEQVECGYARKVIADISLPSANPVIITVTAHGMLTDDSTRLEDCNGITGDLEGEYLITKLTADTFSLQGTDGDDYGGAYTSGGTSGYSGCNRTLEVCRERENSDRFGGFPGIRNGTVRLA